MDEFKIYYFICKNAPPVVAYTGVKVHCTKAILYE